MDQGLGTADIAVIIIYVLLIFGIGVALSKRASRNTEEFFVSGRSLPWWIVGTSMVATTFAADTPLVVSGLIAKGGIFENWFWWQYGIGGMVAVFLFASLWKRSGVTTDAELIELRYDGRPAAALRCYKATWFGLFQNVLIIAWVMKAMAKIILVVMRWDESMTVLGMNAEVVTVLGLFIIAVTYTALSGLWGVVVTDVIQFVMAMGGSIYLAVAAVRRLGGLDAVRDQIAANGFSVDQIYRIIPQAQSLTEANPFTEFLLLVLVAWWAMYNFDGGGYLAQRLFAARDERNSVLGYLWYAVAHIVLRPWPWIVVGLCGMAMYGTVDDPETYYPLVMRSVLPPGIFGIIVASFFAAFMSTIDTQLNWGSSLLVNDILRRFIWKGRSEKQYLAMARLSVLILAVLGALASFAVKDISLAWKLVYSITAGLGTVYIARWYWWRVNAWSEITAMVTALACTIVFWILSRKPGLEGHPALAFPYSLAITVAVAMPAWITVTLLTRPVGSERLAAFYTKVRPGGKGWKHIYNKLGMAPAAGSSLRTFVDIIAGIVALNAALIGVGKLILGETGIGIVYIAIAAVSGVFLSYSLKRFLR
jgi:Na+/proline symporter